MLYLRTGFHTFDYARHFISCCSRMLGLEHETIRGSISLEYYGRNVGIKIMPTGVLVRLRGVGCVYAMCLQYLVAIVMVTPLALTCC